ncbi:MAG: hypothetical protein IKY82_04750 [Alistipes sp.]|nr:hypothetical protein [Alistipes sp.]
MKTFRLVGAALLAVLMCVNFTSCSKDDDANTETGGNENGNGGAVVVSEKKLTKITCKDNVWDATYIFSYDSEGRLKTATYNETDGESAYNFDYQYIWGDDAIVVKEKFSYPDGTTSTDSYSFTLKDGLVQSSSSEYQNGTYFYNSSNRFIKAEYDRKDYSINVVWDKDKIVSVKHSDTYSSYYTTITYGETCKKGYLPLIVDIIDLGYILFMAHPEIAGLRTNQLPNTYTSEDFDICATYEFDKDGYISKIKETDEDGDVTTYTLTWK